MRPTAELWEETLSIIEERLDNKDFSTWFENRFSSAHYDRMAGILFLGVDDFCLAQLELKYTETVERAASEIFETPIKVCFVLPEEADARKVAADRADFSDAGELIPHPRYTFDNFIVGDNNRYAADAAQVVAQAPGKSYSPLFIYGDSGLGKTHLMHAIGIYVLEHFPNLRVLYVSSETFTDDFVNASIHKKMSVFKEKYRRIDVLLIDDIQFISEKEKTVEEVFNTYEALYNSGKQMVFTSDRPPKDILGIDERLRGRLQQGLLVDLKPPSYEIKVAILKNKAKFDKVQEDEGLSEVIAFIAEHIKSNVRDLESAFNRVVFYGKVSGRPFTKNLAKEVLKDVVKMSGNEPAVKDIKKVVANYFNISISHIDSSERTRALSTPRQIAMYLCRDLTSLSFPKIAEDFKKDYATVHHACEKIKREVSLNEHLRNIVNELTEKIQNEY